MKSFLKFGIVLTILVTLLAASAVGDVILMAGTYGFDFVTTDSTANPINYEIRFYWGADWPYGSWMQPEWQLTINHTPLNPIPAFWDNLAGADEVQLTYLGVPIFDGVTTGAPSASFPLPTDYVIDWRFSAQFGGTILQPWPSNPRGWWFNCPSFWQCPTTGDSMTGSVNFYDNGQPTGTVILESTPTPEPPTLLLLGTTLFGFWGVRKRQ